jgi:hypothetical protein
MVRGTALTAVMVAVVLIAPSAFGAPADCNGDGVVDAADLTDLIAANNTVATGTSMEKCDYDADGTISLNDASLHMAESKK